MGLLYLSCGVFQVGIFVPAALFNDQLFSFYRVKEEKDVSQEIRAPQAWIPWISPEEACCSPQGKGYVCEAYILFHS